MLNTFLTAAAGMILISCGWLVVQRLWLRHFPDRGGADDDALAGHGGCQGCNCGPTGCEREPVATPEQHQEVTHHAP